MRWSAVIVVAVNFLLQVWELISNLTFMWIRTLGFKVVFNERNFRNERIRYWNFHLYADTICFRSSNLWYTYIHYSVNIPDPACSVCVVRYKELAIFIQLQCMLQVFWLSAVGLLYPLATVWVGNTTIVAGCSLQSNVHNLKTKRKKFMRIFVTLHFHLPVQRYRDWQLVWAAGVCFCMFGFYF